MLALLTVGVLTGCATTENEAAPASTTTAPATTVPTTSEPVDRTYTLAELVEDPCRVLSDEEAADVGSVLDPRKERATETYCVWHTVSGAVSFTPYPSVDHTADPKNRRNMTATQVDGHRALLGLYIKDRGCAMYVAHGTGASFKLDESRGRETKPGTCPLSPKFAAAIVANLR